MDNDPLMNQKKAAMIEQIMALKEANDTIIRSRGKSELYFFNKYVLEVEEGKEELVPFHKELCQFVTDDMHRKKLILVPRGHLKSTLITIGYSVFRILNDPNIRILILNATWQMAVDFLTEIKRHLQGNERFIELFGEIAADPEEWSQDRITLKRTNKNIKGPTVWATGIESNLVGSHPDLIIFDDVVNRDNTNTQESNEKIILRYKDALDLLEPGGQLIVIGTRWHEGDLYNWLMDKDTGVIQSYDVFIKKAYEGDLTTGEGFVPLWPAKFTQAELQTRLREKGWYEFSAQYMNNPVPDESALFQRRFFQYYDLEDMRGKDMTKVLTIDPAISQKKEADYTAFIVSGVDIFGNIFILDIYRGRFQPKEIIDTIFTLNTRWKPNIIGVETIAYQKALAYFLREAAQERHEYLPIVELKSHEKSKEERIKGLQPSYQAMKVFHPKGHRLTPYFEAELTSFPRGQHDDMVDAFSFSTELLFPPKKKVGRYQHKYLY